VTALDPADVRVRPYDRSVDEDWAELLLAESLGGRTQARRDELVDVLAPGLGFVVEVNGRPRGLLTYRPEAAVAGSDPGAVELSAMVVDARQQGLGTRLLSALEAAVRGMGRTSIRVVTTNDNVDALRFYQRRGFRIAEFRIGAVDRARRELKPAIGSVGEYGIPMRDEIELVRDLMPPG